MNFNVFQGCIGEVRIGGLLLPYFIPSQLNATNSLNHFALDSDSEIDVDLGCFLCFPSECTNGGRLVMYNSFNIFTNYFV